MEDIYALQPMIKYNSHNEKYDYKDYKYYCTYSFLCNDGFSIVPDGCHEFFFTWMNRKSAFFTNINRQLMNYDIKGMYVHAIEVHPLYRLDLNENEINDMLNEMCRIMSPSDRDLFIQERIKKHIVPASCHKLVPMMLKMICDSKGRITIEEMAYKLGYSERHINNLFKNIAGYGPKDFCRIERFQNSILEILRDPYRNNSEFIEKLSYSDQAHFQREFKTFSGMTPKEMIENCCKIK